MGTFMSLLFAIGVTIVAAGTLIATRGWLTIEQNWKNLFLIFFVAFIAVRILIRKEDQNA